MKKLLAGLLFVPVMAHAGFHTGNTLLNKMNAEEGYQRMYALGFVIGVHDALEDSAICTGNQVTAGQLRDVVKKYLENNPAQRDMSAMLLTMVALGQAFPCKQPKGKNS